MKTKEVPSSDLEMDLFWPPPTAAVLMRGAKGRRVLPRAPPIDPPTPQRRTQSTIQSKTTPLGMVALLTDKYILCLLNDKVCQNEID